MNLTVPTSSELLSGAGRTYELTPPPQVQGLREAEEQLTSPLDLTAYWQARYPRYQLAPHIELMLKELNDLGDGEGLIITMPPRHSKSESVKAWLEWSLGQSPESEAILASYAIDLARRHSRSIRNEIAFGQAFKRHFPGVSLAPDSSAATDWALEQGGRFKAAGVGVGITGMGARFGVIDDPFKDRKAAESEVIREGVWDWFTTAFLTRLTPDARVVITHTRWHENDLVGRIRAMLESGEVEELGGLTWRILDLPAIAEEAGDVLGRQIGEALWESRYSAKRLRSIEQTIGPYDWAAVYQQRPRPKGGAVFSDQPARYEVPDRQGARIVAFVDTAASKKETADYTALVVVAGKGAGENLSADVLEVRRDRLDLLQLASLCEDVQTRYGCTIHVEHTAQSLPLIQYLQSRRVRVQGVKPWGDKFTRAQPFAAAWNSQRVRLPVSAPWVPEYVKEHASFTGTGKDAHDDQVDAGAGAWHMLAQFQPAAPRRGRNLRGGA